MEEVAEHNTPEDLWIVIYGRVYDVTEWQNEVSFRLYNLFLLSSKSQNINVNERIASRRGLHLAREWWKRCLRGIQKCPTLTRCTSYSLQFHHWTSQETREQTLNIFILIALPLYLFELYLLCIALDLESLLHPGFLILLSLI